MESAPVDWARFAADCVGLGIQSFLWVFATRAIVAAVRTATTRQGGRS